MRKPLLRRQHSSAACLAAACIGAFAWPGAATAELIFSPYVSAQHEHHSNIFAQPENDTGDLTATDDNIRRALAGVETGYQWTRQKLRLSGEGRRVEYERFDNLNHDEYRLGGGLDWQLFSNLSGTIDVDSERRMASFANRRDTVLTMERDRSGRASLDIMVSPTWSVGFGGRDRQLKSPLPGVPDFGLREAALSVNARYHIDTVADVGLMIEQANGHFDGLATDSRYRLGTVQLTGRYAATGLSSFDGLLGYSVIHAEDDPDLEDVAGVTGSLGYTRQVSGLTDFNLRAYRRVGSYIAGANATTEAGASAGLSWRPRVDLTLSAGYTWSRHLFDILAHEAAVEAGRSDRSQEYNLKAGYQVWRWLLVQAYGQVRERFSNIDLYDFNEVVAGVDIRMRWQ